MSSAVSFEVFKEQCEWRGYTSRVYQEQNNCILYTNNGVKCEIKKNHYTFGWLLKPEDVQTMRLQIIAAGFSEKIGKRSDKRKDDKDFINVPFEDNILEVFWELVGIIESIESIVKKTRGQAIKPFSKEISERNIFEKIAKRFRNAIDNEDGFGLENTRSLLEGDSIDYLITIGESKNRTVENSYREHIVPCIMIYNQAITMTMGNCSVTEVAQMIKTNLAIVLISKEEQELLDYDLDLQTTMPTDWKFGDDVFARLKVGKILLK